MLKHCSPSAVDVRRRSRRNLVDNDNINDAMSVHSTNSSTSTTSRSSSIVSPLPMTMTSEVGSSTNPVTFRDASTSPLISRVRIHYHNNNLKNDGPSKIPIKIYARCLRADIEYKTMIVGASTTSRELIWQLLSKFRMKHRDPKLFYLTMDILPLRRSLALEDDSRPVELQSCHPWGECKFALQARKGGVVRVYDSVLMAESKYKCLLIAEHTTVEDVIRMLFHCYGLEGVERANRFRICVESADAKQLRVMTMDERPMVVQSNWGSRAETYKFVLRSASDFEDDDDDSESSSDYSELRFERRMTTSSSTTSTDSGLLTSPTTSNIMTSTRTTDSAILNSISLHSLLEALPAASVDTGLMDSDGTTSKKPPKRASITSSLSLDDSASSSASECDSYFYI